MNILLAYFRRHRLIYGLTALYILAVLLNAVGFYLWLPSCMVTCVTGYECLGCGLNRAAMALFSGDLATAFTFNPLIFIYLPGGLAWAGYDFYKFYQQSNQTAL